MAEESTPRASSKSARSIRQRPPWIEETGPKLAQDRAANPTPCTLATGNDKRSVDRLWRSSSSDAPSAELTLHGNREDLRRHSDLVSEWYRLTSAHHSTTAVDMREVARGKRLGSAKGQLLGRQSIDRSSQFANVCSNARSSMSCRE